MERRTLDEQLCRQVATQYKSRMDLAKFDCAVYHKCLELKILDELFPRKLNKYDEQECIRIASMYRFPWELGKANSPVYQMLQHRGLLDKLFPLHRKKKYDEAECLEIARKYDCPGDLDRDFPAVYQKLSKRGLIKALFPDSTYENYNYDICRQAASRFRRKKDFEENAHGEYEKSLKMGWLDGFAEEFHYMSYRESQMVSRIANGTSIGDDEIVGIAKRYTDRTKFIKESGVYELARKRGLLSSFTWMDAKPHVWSDTVYAYEFPQTHVAYVGRTGRPDRRDYEHRTLDTDSVLKYARSQGVAVPEPVILHGGLSLDEGKRMECAEIEKYLEGGWTLLNRRPGGGAGNIGYTISKSGALRIARKYSSLKLLRQDHPKLVQRLYSRNWISECTWLERIRPPKVRRGHWDVYDNVRAEALKYGTEQEFNAKAWGAYCGAVRNNWLGKLFHGEG